MHAGLICGNFDDTLWTLVVPASFLTEEEAWVCLWVGLDWFPQVSHLYI